MFGVCSQKKVRLETRSKGAKWTFITIYKQELDVFPECKLEMLLRLHQLIGVLWWAIELGRIDILMEVVMLSQYQANQRGEHQEGLYLLFHCLWKNPCKKTVFDTEEPDVDAKFNLDANWTKFYGNMIKKDPPNMPEPLETPVIITAFVDVQTYCCFSTSECPS